MLTIRPASATDMLIIEENIADAIARTRRMGDPMWNVDQPVREWLWQRYRPEQFRLAFHDGAPAAGMALQEEDSDYWDDVPTGSALFLHKLTVRQCCSGLGLADRMIEYAKAECVRRGIPTLRLDCYAHRTSLRTLYERNGFICVGVGTIGRYRGAYYVFPITADAMIQGVPKAIME